jgi:hypothetical protein
MVLFKGQKLTEGLESRFENRTVRIQGVSI